MFKHIFQFSGNLIKFFLRIYTLMILTTTNLCLCYENDISLFPNLPLAPLTSKNEQCKSDCAMYLENLENITLWSYQMWEASAKSTAGSLQGNRFHMGDWDECMKVKAPFNTQYCLVVVKANINGFESDDPYALDRDPRGSVLYKMLDTHDVSQMPRDTANIGWCVPASCTTKDLENAIHNHFSHSNTTLMKYNVTYSGKVLEELCDLQGKAKSFDVLDIVFCIVVAIFFLAVTIATIYELKINQVLPEEEKGNYQKYIGWKRILLNISAMKNFIELAKTDKSNPALSSIYGLRTISIFIIIIAHSTAFYGYGPIQNFIDIEHNLRSIIYTTVVHADLLVDTFFVISGIMVTYGLLLQPQRNPFYVIFLRYMRITPSYAFVVFSYATVFKHVGSGPLWKTVAERESEDCKNNWWLNLLYINNYVNAEYMCMIQSWYLACDYHYFIIATFTILVFQKNKTLGSVLFILCFMLSIAVPFTITIIYKCPALFRFNMDFMTKRKAHPDFVFMYIKSHTRAASYCIGMMGGYTYYKLKGAEKRLSKLKSHFIVLISVLLLLLSMGSAIIFYNPYHKYNTLEAGFYAAFNRLTWSVGTMGLLLTASFGHSTIIQKFLSWPPLIPLGKLVYSVYLIHISIQFSELGMTSTPQRFYNLAVLSKAFSDCVLSFIMGLVLYILIEIPIRNVFKELFILSRNAVSPAESLSMKNSVVNKKRRKVVFTL